MYTIQPYKPVTDEEYTVLVNIHNTAWPDELTALESWRHRDNTWPEGKVRQRFVASNGSEVMAEGAFMETRWANAPGKYFYYYTLLPAWEEETGLHRMIYEYVLGALAEREPKAVITEAREDREYRMRWLESQGFVSKMRFAVSELDISNFDFSRFNGAQERVAEAGVQITPLAEVRERDPRWMEKLYEMFWEIEQDIPQSDPPVKEPYEEYVKGYENPNFWPEGWFMAIDPTLDVNGPAGEYVGVSMLAKNPAMPQRLNTWLTGVLRSHRRKGLALAMKLRAVEFAIQQGATKIRTDNEENNPMLGINKLLGFEEVPAWVEFEKKL